MGLSYVSDYVLAMMASELRDSFPFNGKKKGKYDSRDGFIRDYGKAAVGHLKQYFEGCEDITVNDISNMIGCYDRFMSDVIKYASFRYIRLEGVCCISPKYSIFAKAARSLDFRKKCGKMNVIVLKTELSCMYSFLWHLYHRTGKYYLSEEYIELRRDYKVQARTGDNSGTAYIRRDRLTVVLLSVLYYICKYFKSHKEAMDYAKENYEASPVYQELSTSYCRVDKRRGVNG